MGGLASRFAAAFRNIACAEADRNVYQELAADRHPRVGARFAAKRAVYFADCRVGYFAMLENENEVSGNRRLQGHSLPRVE